jgi:hypothetical protein
MQQTLKMRNDGYAAYSAHDFIWDFYARHQGLEMNFVAKRNCLLFLGLVLNTWEESRSIWWNE